MDMNFDMENRLAGSFELSAGNHASEQLDWHGLRARLAAAYAVRSVLDGAKPQESAVEGGSFEPGCARALAVYGFGPGCGLGGINPTALGNCNSGCDNDAAVAGPFSAGDRG